MPYSQTNKPKHLGNLPDAAMKVWISAFNSAYEQASGKNEKEREAYANKVAWSATKKAGRSKNNTGEWMKNKSELVEMTMAVTKASFDPTTQVMRIRMVTSDTGPDVYDERMSLQLFNDFTSRIEQSQNVPEPYKSVLAEKSGWNGGMPYVSVAHYKSGIEGKNIPADTEKVYVDGECLKATAICRNTPLGKAVFKALKEDINGKSKYSDKVRVSIGFLDLSHSHGDFVFERKGLENTCPMCENGVGNKVYLKGILVHLALTRKPANPRTDAEVDKSMTDEITTRQQDAESIVGEELADEIVQNKSVLDDVENELITVKSDAVEEEKNELVEEAASAPAEPDVDENHPADCTCKACMGKKKMMKSALDASFDALKDKIVEVKSMPKEDALREVQPLFDALGKAVQDEFVAEKSVVEAKIDPALQELLTSMKSAIEGLSGKISSVSEELTIVKSQLSVGMKSPQPTVAESTPAPRNIQVERTAQMENLVARAFASADKPLSIKELALRSVQNQ